MTVRIAPLDPPYAPDVAASLDKWMPPALGLPPLALFRTLARHPMLRDRMLPLGSGLLHRGALPSRVRELLILRTSARCGAGYEWGVHVTIFAASAGLDDDTVRTTTSDAEAIAARTDDDALVMRVADELHDRSTISDALFDAVSARFGHDAVLEMCAIAGFYHLIAFVIRAARVEDEAWAAKFPYPAGG